MNTKSWRWLLLLASMLVLVVVTTASAQGPLDSSTWVTVCHVPHGDTEAAKTIQIAWATLDKCLSYFGDYMGPCVP